MRLPHSYTPSPLAAYIPISFLVLGLLSLSGCAEEKKPAPVTIEETTTTPSVRDTNVDADVPFVVTPQKTVEGMLELARVTERDTVYDLGSGDGRIPITAAQKYGARGVGIEIKPELIERARKNAKLSGVREQVEFRQNDLFDANFSEATVVTLYLFPEINLKLRPMLFEQLKPGTRVVSHSFDMDEWKPDSSVNVDGDILYLWTIPEAPPEFVQSNQ